MDHVQSNFEQQALKHESANLKYYTSKANEEQEQERENKYITNLSLTEIASNISLTFILIINELLDSNITKDTNSVINIFFKDNRMLYIGLTVLLVAFGIYIIDITS